MVREFLAGKTDEQAIEDDLRRIQHIIGLLVERTPETILPEEQFGRIVPLSQQRTVWTQIFADFPGLLQWHNTFLPRSLMGLLITLIIIPTMATFLNESLLLWKVYKLHIWSVLLGVIALPGIILLQFFHFRHRCYYHSSTLREIAEKMVAAKKQYTNYPIGSVDDVEPILLHTLSEAFEIPLDSLTAITRLDLDLGFVL
jgi:hypothetical protein